MQDLLSDAAVRAASAALLEVCALLCIASARSLCGCASGILSRHLRQGLVRVNVVRSSARGAIP